MIKVAIFTSKGGTGKTTTAINLAHGLALAGKKVLLIDCDAQGSAAGFFGVQSQKTLADLLVKGEVDLTRVRSNLFVIDSGGKHLAEAELYLATRDDREIRLRDRLKHLQGAEYVLCDCSPSINLINLNALAFCDYLLVPVSMDWFAVKGAEKTLNLVSEVQQYLAHTVQLAGILGTFYDSRTNISKKIWQQLVNHYGNQVLATKIRINTHLKEAQLAGKTIFEYSPYAHGAIDYFLLTKEILGNRLFRPQPEMKQVMETAWTTSKSL